MQKQPLPEPIDTNRGIFSKRELLYAFTINAIRDYLAEREEGFTFRKQEDVGIPSFIGGKQVDNHMTNENRKVDNSPADIPEDARRTGDLGRVADHIESWEESFNEKFNNGNFILVDSQLTMNLAIGTSKDVKSFISNLLSQTTKAEQERIVGIVEGMKVKNDSAECLHKKPRDVTASEYDCSDNHIGYEEALSDLSDNIRK